MNDESICIFHYEFHPENTLGEEPEGLTIWDQDFGLSSFIDGQLHILMTRQTVNHEVYLKHYTNRQFLFPASDIQAVHDGAWAGSVLSFTPGSYTQLVVFNRKVLLETPSGTAAISGQ